MIVVLFATHFFGADQMRNAPRAYFFRHGVELSYHPANGRSVLGFGIPMGKVGKLDCFHGVTLAHPDDEYTEADFGGEPVRVLVVGDNHRCWFAIASAETVDSITAAKELAK